MLDGWTDINNTSVWVIIALLPNIGPIVLETINGSAESHTGEWISGKHHVPTNINSLAMHLGDGFCWLLQLVYSM